jgi:septal ring factor EnvC (AmiA/AmiB activator)
MTNRLHIKLIGCLLILGVCSSLVFGQTYDQKREKILKEQESTRAEINVLDARIKAYQQRVAEAEAKFNKSYRQFENLNSLIALQDDKIRSLTKEQKQIEEEIELTQTEIDQREKELDMLIENYKKIILFAYKNGRSTNLELLLTADSFNEMLVRSYYLKKFEEQKAKQAQQIRKRKEELDQIKIDLRQSLNKNKVVLQQITEEKQTLNGQRSQQKKTVDTIRSQKSTLVAELTKSRQQKEALQNAFNELIAEADEIEKLENERLIKLARARKIADESVRNREVAKYSKPIVREAAVTSEMLLADEQKFAALKGQLPWPVSSRTISKKFGKTRNPVYGTVTEYLGVNIVTDPAAPVKVVSDGYVSQIAPITGFGDVVFVKHGSYYTAYGNLSKINVSKNQVLKAGDIVGLSGVGVSPMGENLLFVVRHKDYQDPMGWLQK